LYYDAQKQQYYWWNSTSQSFYQDSNRTQKVLDSKAYIDMPNLDFFTFLDPRNFFWGIRFSVDL
jgi:hypothetical protein